MTQSLLAVDKRNVYLNKKGKGPKKTLLGVRKPGSEKLTNLLDFFYFLFF